MKIFILVVLAILVLLSLSSGVTKILLMEQDVTFFGKYGFTNSMLIAFGIVQIIGGCLLIFERTRVLGAGLIALTFLISLVLLLREGSILFSLITIIALGLLGFLIRQRLSDARTPNT